MPSLAIFVDGGYLDAVCRRHLGGVRLDYGSLGRAIQEAVAERTTGHLEHLRTYYYTCPPYQTGTPTPEERRLMSGYQRFADAVSSLPRFDYEKGGCSERVKE